MLFIETFVLSGLLFCSANAAQDRSQHPGLGIYWRSLPSVRQGGIGFDNPLGQDGGSMLTKALETIPLGQGEPLNVILSANSDPTVLQEPGLSAYFLSLGYGPSCGGIDLGDKQAANLGDGNGFLNQTGLRRYDFGNPTSGTCLETLVGGNHFRYWLQDGASANSGAVFLAASIEMDSAANHDIVSDGYNLGRDALVANATQASIPSPNPFASAGAAGSGPALIPNVQYNGTSSLNGWSFQTTANYVSGLLEATSVGVNHNQTVPVDGRPALDGLVALFTVHVTSRPSNTSSTSSKNSASQRNIPFNLVGMGFLSVVGVYVVA